MFKAILLSQQDGRTHAEVTELDDAQLPSGNVTVDVAYSTINYKDGLAITGQGPVVRQWPMVPGIDFAGTVSQSDDPRFSPGQQVLLNGWGVGETHWGGLAQRARVPGDYLIALPEGLSPRAAMGIGTAGYTAMLSVQALQQAGLAPGDGEVLVTGANGGVGSFAVAILARLGYRVAASTGRPQAAQRLRDLGASEIIDRATLSEKGKPLQKERWAGAVDSVGGHTLANICASLRYGGVVTACGLAQSMDLPASVAPFILRGVSLLGIDSVRAARERREAAWQALARTLEQPLIDRIAAREVGLAQAIEAGQDILRGTVQGRVIVDPNR
ncbi:MDR family oxidoreductase [Orrella sp. JC864]|uniref:acrylyl-CoA reductase (NADPH) n=1 Tax=Orrella sp. JC864 TaxID=3120298 RepID=UPI0012BD43D3